LNYIKLIIFHWNQAQHILFLEWKHPNHFDYLQRLIWDLVNLITLDKWWHYQKSLKRLPLTLYTFREITIASKTDYLGTNHVRQLPKARGVPSPAAVLDLNFDWTHDQPEPELELKKVTKTISAYFFDFTVIRAEEETPFKVLEFILFFLVWDKQFSSLIDDWQICSFISKYIFVIQAWKKENFLKFDERTCKNKLKKNLLLSIGFNLQSPLSDAESTVFELYAWLFVWYSLPKLQK
jgi:hypothetical protein